MALTRKRLRQLLRYDPETGLFYWMKRTSNRAKVGAVAGCKCKKHGYILIGIDGVVYPAHRLAWFYMHNVWPEYQIDHANCVRDDNRATNLRECSHAENHMNVKRPAHNTSGFKGVHYHPQSGKWRARIAASKRHISLGLHKTKEDAHAAYCRAAEKLHGDFARFQ